MDVFSSAAVPRSACLERARRAYESAWRDGRRPIIERFLNETPETERPALLAELVALELAWRRRRGEAPAAEEYQ